MYYSVYSVCAVMLKAILCCFRVISAVQGVERLKRTMGILANVSGLCLKSSNYSMSLPFLVRCQVHTLVSLDISKNRMKAAEAEVLAQGIPKCK